MNKYRVEIIRSVQEVVFMEAENSASIHSIVDDNTKILSISIKKEK